MDMLTRGQDDLLLCLGSVRTLLLFAYCYGLLYCIIITVSLSRIEYYLILQLLVLVIVLVACAHILLKALFAKDEMLQQLHVFNALAVTRCVQNHKVGKNKTFMRCGCDSTTRS